MRKLVFSITEAAKLLGVHPNTIRRMVWRGELRPVRLGRRVLIPLTEVERLLGAAVPAAHTAAEAPTAVSEEEEKGNPAQGARG